MKRFFTCLRRSQIVALSILAFVADITAQVGAGSASSWGGYQPKLPEELKR